MGRIRFYARMDKARFARLTHQVTEEAARRAAEKTRLRIIRSILVQGRVRTGDMARSIIIEPIVPYNPKRAGFKVGSNLFYYHYQNDGVRPFGPIKPGGVLVFIPKGGTHVVFARHVKGFPGGHFSEDAVRALRAKDFY